MSGDKIVGKNNVTDSFVNENGEHLKFTNKSMSMYSTDPRDKHSSTHINVNHEKGTVTVNTKDSNGNKSSNTGNCYLTSACMKHFKDDFDDDCYELTVLRLFRDKFVLREDIEHYYKVAPLIIQGIEVSENSDAIYNYIYENVVKACVDALENKDYVFAYNRYKNSVLAFEEVFAKPILEHNSSELIKNR